MSFIACIPVARKYEKCRDCPLHTEFAVEGSYCLGAGSRFLNMRCVEVQSPVWCPIKLVKVEEYD